MEITFLGHASFRIKGRQASLVTDPFDPEMTGLKFPKVTADIVTVSHEHQDHARSDLPQGVKRVISGPGEYEIRGISIIGLPSFHDSKGGAERGRNTIYVIEIDGFRVVHLGDLGHSLSDDQVGSLGDVDILMIPVGGVYSLGPKEASETVEAIEPYITMPMHYKTEGLKEETFGSLEKVDAFISQLELPVKKLPKLVLKDRGSLEEEEVVVILDKQ